MSELCKGKITWGGNAADISRRYVQVTYAGDYSTMHLEDILQITHLLETFSLTLTCSADFKICSMSIFVANFHSGTPFCVGGVKAAVTLHVTYVDFSADLQQNMQWRWNAKIHRVWSYPKTSCCSDGIFSVMAMFICIVFFSTIHLISLWFRCWKDNTVELHFDRAAQQKNCSHCE